MLAIGFIVLSEDFAILVAFSVGSPLDACFEFLSMLDGYSWPSIDPWCVLAPDCLICLIGSAFTSIFVSLGSTVHSVLGIAGNLVSSIWLVFFLVATCCTVTELRVIQCQPS